MSDREMDWFREMSADMRKAIKKDMGEGALLACVQNWADCIDEEAERVRKAKQKGEARRRQCFDGILSDIRQLRQAARESRKEYDAQDTILALLSGFARVFLCGIQLATTLCILIAKRRMQGRSMVQTDMELIGRLVRRMQRMEVWA